jgi:hypothetical protein
MTIEEFLQELYADELSDAFAGNRNNILEGRAKLFTLMNTAMAYAYAKWKVNYQTTMLNITEDTTTYTLYEPDLLQVVQLINVYGLEVPLSEYQVLGSTIYFPYPQTQTLQVVYKTKPEKFVTTQTDSAVELSLPDLLIPWFKAYICHRYYAAMANDVGVAKAAHFLALATLAEQDYAQSNTTNEFTAPTNTKMSARGFA